ncbi:BatA and WFA domain-containing protein [bacterium]|nr:BatA and WFA domain-containing protein [bacterium]
MTFLAPAFWIGLTLAALPILIHLLGRRRLKKQPFSSLEFLRRLQTKRMRKLRLKQILLLILRTLAVLALALAFLRPALQTAGFAGAGSSATVIVADQSASMSARRGEEVPVDRATEIAQAIWRAGGEVGLVTADATGDRDIAPREANGEVPRWLRQFETDGRAASFAPALHRAARYLEESDAASKEIIVLSDFAGAAPDSLPELADDITLWRMPLAGDDIPNLAITGMRLGEVMLRPGATGTMNVSVQQFGGRESIPVLVTITLDGRVVAEGELTVPESGAVEQAYSFRVPESGQHVGRIELDLTDALLADNTHHFVLTVPGERSILLVGDDFGALRYAELALNPEGKSTVFDVTVRPGPLRNVARLDNYDAVVYAGAVSPSQADARRLKQFTDGGGGLWLVLGENADLAAWSRTVLPEFGFGGLVEGGARGVREWDTLNRDHPALNGLLEGEGRYDKPSVARVYTVTGGSGTEALVRLSDGTAFLLERTDSAGRVWLTPSAMDTEWTDWPVSGVFAPMLQQGVLWLAGAQPQAGEIACGDPILWPVPDGTGRSSGEVIAPQDQRLSAEPAFRGGRQVWITPDTRWPGSYELQVDEKTVNLAAANVPVSESDLSASQSGWPGSELRIPEDETLADALTQARVGREMTPWLLLIALLALIAETLVARDKKQSAPERDAVPVAGER